MHKIPIKYHLLFWFGFVILSIAALSPYYMNLYKATMHRLVFIPVWLIGTYINLFILMPKLWDLGRRRVYCLSLFSLVMGLTVLQRVICIKYIYPQYFWVRVPNENELNPFWAGPFIQFAAFIALPIIISIGLRQGWKWYQESYKAKQIIAQQQEAELNYLKAQINPHFLFNTLNNLYGLSLESSKKVPDMILKLSDLLSYSLYESQVSSIPIEKELKLIQDFIALEKTRYEERVEVNLNIGVQLDLSKRIAPLVMLPLVENAFKHGVVNMEFSQPIEILLDLSKNQFTFKVENYFLPEEGISTTKGGIGISNLKRRLALRYPDKHHFSIAKNQNKFVVTLKIDLDE